MRKLVPVFLIFISVLSFTSPFAQKKGKPVATIGKENITDEEYRMRFELMPHVGSNDWNLDTTKFEFLCTLIAEKLWGLEAAKAGFDTADAVKFSYKELEKMYVRDALYKEVIENKIEIPQQEILKGVFRQSVKLKINVLTTKDSSEIFRLYSSLQKGASFDSILHTRPEFRDQDSGAMEISYGQMEDFVEDTIYNLKAGSFSVPVKNKAAWFIFKLQDKIESVFGGDDQEKTLSSVKKIIKDKMAAKLYGEYYNKFFVGRRVEANGILFWAIADKVIPVLVNKRKDPDYDKVENIYLTTDDILGIEKELGPDTLKMELIKLDKKSVSVKNFLRNLMFDGFYSNKFDPKILAAKLNARVKNYIESELLADEAYGKGLQNLPDVKRDIGMWKLNYMGQLMKVRLKDSVKITDNDLYNYYLDKQKNKDNNVALVNIQEILTDSLEVIEKVLNEIKAGHDFAALAKIHTKRTWTKDKGGEFGFFPVTAYGEIGTVAEKMKVGEVYGPLKLPEGYSVFKLLAKKQEQDTVKKAFEEIKSDLKKEYFGKKYQDILVKKTADLADKYNVTINKQALKDLNVVNLNMYTYRYMGFGGRINAVPLPAPLYQWYDQFKQSKRDLP